MDDEILDALPLHLRNKVLASIEVNENGEVTRAPYVPKKKKVGKFVGPLPKVHDHLALKVTLSMIWGMFWTLFGLICFMSIILIPVGFVLLIVGALPLAKTVVAHLARRIQLIPQEELEDE